MSITKSVAQAKTNTTKSVRKKPFKIGIISPLQKNKNNVLVAGIEGFCELGFKTSIVAEGDTASQQTCLELLKTYGKQISVHESINTEKEAIIKKSDIIVFGQKPLKSEIDLILKHNTPCVLPQDCGFSNFNPQNETGEAFTYEYKNFWSFMAAIIRASENKKFAYDWRILKKNLNKITQI